MTLVPADSLPPDGEHAWVEIDGFRLPVHYQAGSTDTLIVLFHGAVDQKLRPRPHFQPHFRHVFGAHQLAVSDISLHRSDELKLGWYLGTDDLPLPGLLARYFHRLAQTGRFKRIIFFGASGGGHAALYHSFHQPGSLALVVNPQIDLGAFQPRDLFDDYRRLCWPAVADIEQLRTLVPFDLRSTYAGPMRNFVCVLNSSGDRHHVFDQTAGLMSCIPAASRNRVVFHADYYGVPGHAVSVPYKSCVPWIKACVHSPNLFADSILKKLHQFASAAASAQPNAPASQPRAALINGDDLRINELLLAHQLGKRGG